MTETNWYTYIDMNVFEFLKYAVQYLKEIFMCKVDHFWFDIDRMENISKIFEFDITNCYHLRLDGKRYLEDDEMLNVIEKTATKELSLFVKLSDTFYCDPEFFKTDYLELGENSSKWILKETFLRLQCIPRIRVEYRWNRIFFHRPFIAFISQWYHSDNRRFEQLAFVTWWGIADHVFEQFNSRKYDPKERGPAFRFNSRGYNCESGIDILRRDGLLATVYNKTWQNQTTIYFHVWHERFPQLGNIPIY